ncbi:NBR1-Ig-like domain-containing protein [Chloroflexota bacterium]
MDYEQAEGRFRELHTQLTGGTLDDETFRVEVAKLLLRGDGDDFWMLDADTGEWYRNRGDGWVPGDPYAALPIQAAQPDEPKAQKRRSSRFLILGVVLLTLLCVAAGVLLWQVADDRLTALQLTPSEDSYVQVAIASPADGSEVLLGQAVAIESMIDAHPGLQLVDRVELQVNDQTVDSQPIQPRIQPDQTSLPLAQAWRPTEAGEYLVVVKALSGQGDPLGEAGITLQVTGTSDEVQPEPGCVPDAIFVAHGSIPANTVFPPGARVSKVWRVRNSGSCAWGMGYELILVDGPDMGAQTSVPVPPTAAGEATDLSIAFRAPADPGDYGNAWQLRSTEGEVFGPSLLLTIRVGVLTEEQRVPMAPANVQATATEDGEAVNLTWDDRSDNEKVYRIYRTDLEASIGLAPANAVQFVDEGVACGNSYAYAVVAFSASGIPSTSELVGVTLPPCAPPDTPPSLVLTAVPSTVVASEVFAITFEAEDDVGVAQVVVWGRETGDPVLDSGQVFSCTEAVCSGSWTVTRTQEISASWTFMALAFDDLNQGSGPVLTMVVIRPPE